MANNFHTNFNHVPYFICATAKFPITITDVGTKIFAKPEADWKDVTNKLDGTCENDPKGPIIPIVAAASPDEDGIKSDIGI